MGEFKEEKATSKRREKKLAAKEEKVLGKEIPEAQTDKIVTARHTVPNQCGNCGDRLTIGGPIWHEPIHNLDFVKRMYDFVSSKDGKKFGTHDRIKGILGAILDESVCKEEALSFDFSQVCSNIKVVNPTQKEVQAGFASLGYKLVQTYYEPKLWKTDASPEIVYDIFKQFKKEFCEREKQDYMLNIHEQSPFYNCLKRELKVKPDFNTDKLEN